MSGDEPTRVHSASRAEAEGRGEDWLPGPSGGDLAAAPPPARWLDWLEPSPRPGVPPRRVVRVPFACDHCGAGCGLLASVDPTTQEVLRVEGNPLHPGSRGRVCAAGPDTLSQVRDPRRLLHPLRRVGPRGGGRWEKISWDDALNEIATRMREAIEGERLHEILVHQGQPDPDPFTARAVSAWGLDALCSDTTAGAPNASTGYQFWTGSDRLGVDLSQAKTILLVGSPRDGSPLHPDPRRVLEAKRRGARLIVVEPVRGSLAAHADLWLPAKPGTEPVLLLAIAHHLIRTRATNRDFMRRWWNWVDYMEARYPGVTLSFPRFELALQKLYAHYSVEFAERECGLPAASIQAAAEWVAGARTELATWCGGAATEGNLGGWQVSRTLFLLNALLGAVGTPGGVSPGAWWRFLPESPWSPPPPDIWNELAWPADFPLAFGPASPLLPWLLRRGQSRLSVYLTERFNPVGSSPDGFAWADLLKDEDLVAFHAALTPVWTETAQWADLLLPVGFAPERHGLVSAESSGSRWIALRQPVVAIAKAAHGVPFEDARRSNPGSVWEEEDFWIQLAWKLDPTGEWGIRDHFESRQFRGERLRLDEYYATMLEHGVPELGEAAMASGETALQYLRRHGAFQVEGPPGPVHERMLRDEDLENVREGRDGRAYALRRRSDLPQGAALSAEPAPDGRGRVPVGLRIDGELREGFSTPSARLEFYSPTLSEWGWPEYALPTYIKSHIHRDLLQDDELVWVPLFEAPSAEGALWSAELAHINPLWMNPLDASRLGLRAGDATRVETEIGHFVTRAWVTESIRPGVVACNPTRARWRLLGADGPHPQLAAVVSLHIDGDRRSLAREEGVAPGPPGTEASRVWWTDTGAPATLAMPVHPDPVTGAHCWNQVVRVRPAQNQDLPGDATADLARAQRIIELWLQRTRGAADNSPDRTRRPRWLIRAPKPMADAWKLP